MADLRCTINDTSVPPYARMHCYDIAQFKETGRLLCPCGHEPTPDPLGALERRLIDKIEEVEANVSSDIERVVTDVRGLESRLDNIEP